MKHPSLTLLLILPLALQAAEVSVDDAATAARAWVDRGYAMGKLPAGRTIAGVDEVADPATGAKLLVARFAGGGYVVLSSDDLVDPVIAFSETGTGLDLDEENPFWALLRGDIAAREAAAGVERGAAASDARRPTPGPPPPSANGRRSSPTRRATSPARAPRRPRRASPRSRTSGSIRSCSPGGRSPTMPEQASANRATTTT